MPTNKEKTYLVVFVDDGALYPWTGPTDDHYLIQASTSVEACERVEDDLAPGNKYWVYEVTGKPTKVETTVRFERVG